MSGNLEWFDLRKRAIDQLHNLGIPSREAGEQELRKWDDVVLRFRKLREALTAEHAAADVRCQVYELSAVVCAAARNMAELLKCLQQLVNNIYPAVSAEQHHAAAAAAARGGRQPAEAVACNDLQQQQQQQQHEGVITNGSNTEQTASWEVFLARHIQQRRAEISAALLLYFACVPRLPVKQELVKQIRLAGQIVLASSDSSTCNTCDSTCSRGQQQQQHNQRQQLQQQQQQQLQQQQQQQQAKSLLLLQHPRYQSALQAASAVLNCNWVQFMRCYQQSSCSLLLRTILECHLDRMRVQILYCSAAAYRMLPSHVLLCWLNLALEQQQRADDDSSSSSKQRLVAQQQCTTRGAGLLESQGGLKTHSASVDVDVRNKVMQLLKLAATEARSKGCGIAFDQCSTEQSAVLPDVLQFRG